MRDTEAALQELPPKKDVALFLLQRSSVFVHLDPRSDDVIVPAGFKREPRLVLQVGHNMAVPIPDLAVSDDGWSGTLSFRRVPFRCVVPWTSVFAMVGQDGQGVVWPEDVPPELAQPGAPAQPAPGQAAATTPKIGLAPAPAPEPNKTSDAELAVADTVDDAKKPKTKAKRPRKKTGKGDKAEPEALDAAASATPTPTPTPAPSPSPSPSPRATPTPEPSSPAPAVAPTAPTFGGKGTKPKRELPPYLRVIK